MQNKIKPPEFLAVPVVVLFISNGRNVLLKHNPTIDAWDLITGEVGAESIENCVRRTLKAQTGLKATRIKLLGNHHKFRLGQFGVIRMGYEVKVVGSLINTDTIGWFAWDQTDKMDLTLLARYFIETAGHYPKMPATKLRRQSSNGS